MAFISLLFSHKVTYFSNSLDLKYVGEEETTMGLVAVVQVTSTDSVEQNLEKVERFVKSAAEQGAGLVVLPENVAFIML
jgi:hypothetical protein